ncbi:MAG: HD domain-containing protein [Planctomycetes bacterium]|nr:HD domain-containing protein [Planctomycetota bacterium]
MKQIFNILNDLASVSRYSQSRLAMDESVLEHTGFVSICCLCICGVLTKAGESINTGLVLQRAAVHDLDEVITGDLPRPTKYDNEMLTGLIKILEEKNTMTIATDIFNDERIFDLWYNAKERSKEGFVVQIADAFAVVYKAWSEQTLYGNRVLRPHAKDTTDRLRTVLDEADIFFQNGYLIRHIIGEVILIGEEIENV